MTFQALSVAGSDSRCTLSAAIAALLAHGIRPQAFSRFGALGLAAQGIDSVRPDISELAIDVIERTTH